MPLIINDIFYCYIPYDLREDYGNIVMKSDTTYHFPGQSIQNLKVINQDMCKTEYI